VNSLTSPAFYLPLLINKNLLINQLTTLHIMSDPHALIISYMCPPFINSLMIAFVSFIGSISLLGIERRFSTII